MNMKQKHNYWLLVSVVIFGIVALATQLMKLDSISKITILAICVIAGIIKLVEMIRDLSRGSYGIDILAISATVACLLTNQLWACYVIVLMLYTGEALETMASRRARSELTALLKRQPKIAHLIIKDQIKDVPLDKIKVGDTVLIKPHEVVPVDGLLESDQASIDESAMTGESVPVEKISGQKIISGTTNSSTAIKVQATTPPDKSYYSKIVKLVRESEAKPARFVNLANRYAIPFTITSYIIAGLAWYLSGDTNRFAEVLVVASPCPLILAAPIAFISGMSLSSRNGIIVKSGTVLEQVAQANTIAFDKTGTLTQGKLVISGVETTQGVSSKEILSIIAAAEIASSHILANTVVDYAKSHNLIAHQANNIREVAGGGVFASIDQQRVVVGSPKFLIKNKILGLPKNAVPQTSIMLSINGQYKGTVVFEDQPRRNAKSVIKRLKSMGVSHIVMLTGDRKNVAAKISKNLGINHFLAELLPQDKVKSIEKLQSQQIGPVIMVGDGVNDAPVLARADVGIAIGSPNDTVASESADAVITVDNINRIVRLRQISSRTVKIALQSVIIGITSCLVLEILAALGFIPALVGAGLQEIIDIIVIANALRVNKYSL